MTKRHNGAVLWRGPSALDGEPIIVVATGLHQTSRNRKTGAMVQTYILRSDVAPNVAVKTGQDASICGDCPHRGNGDGSGRTCYVTVFQGPLSVYRTFARGGYPDATPEDYKRMRGRPIRFGTYGDPAAAPLRVWELLGSYASVTTGYTHQWRDLPTEWRYHLMASADTERDALDAWALGYRTFRVTATADDRLGKREALCPASEEAGRKLTCEQCGACGGAEYRRKGSIFIPLHGGLAVKANAAKLQERLRET